MLQLRERSSFCLLMVLLVGMVSFTAQAQPEYVMSNNLVRDCEGILTDSEMGPEEGQYDHNEDYTFSICVSQANEIIIAFESFASEDRFDVLTVYDGPDKVSPVLATLSGIVQPPPVLIATSGCATLHFVSDSNIVANGWRLRWRVEIDEPEIPDLIADGALDCPLQNGNFRFTLPIDCDLFVPGNFTVVGPGNPTITGVNLLDCDNSTNLGSTFELVFADSLKTPGVYRLEFNGAIQDVCGEWHDISTSVIFTLENCPIQAKIVIVDTACVGSCGRVRADIIGDVASNYNFTWSHTADRSQEVDACFDDTTVISVTVVNNSTNSSTISQITYIPFPNPVFLNKIGIDTFCSSRSNHIFQVSNPGGEFYSRIIPDWHRTTGRYEFWRWWNRDPINEDIIEYYDPNGCVVRDTVYILPVSAGSIQAACQGGSTFQMNGGTPTGGTWEGPHVAPDGTFDPTTAGSFRVTYVAPNGCRQNKTVNVAPGITMPDVDTLCSSKRIDLRDFTDPYGGRWTGPGITNSVLGRLDGWRVTSNMTYTYVYELNGCKDSIDIYIQELYSGPDIALCVDTDTMFLNYTGTWTGPGTYLPTINAFDISGLGEGEYVYTLESDGCTDAFRLYIVDPYIEQFDVLEFCQENYWYSLLDFVNIYPDYGDFTGPNLKDSNDIWFFNPSLLGPGQHLFVYEASGCTDSVWVDVEDRADIPPYQVCEFDDPIQLSADPSGGFWEGPGILDGTTGLFDPKVPGIGNHEIRYSSPRGCLTIDTIEVIPFEAVAISGVDQQYCFSDTNITIQVMPAGGQLTLNGMPTNGTFNPSQLGTGIHEIFYTRGTGSCQSDDRLFFSVLAPISGAVTSSNDSICAGDQTSIEISPEGGSGILSAVWDSPIGFGASHLINPTQSTWYYVTVEDGCSVPYRDSIYVHVYPEFSIDLERGPEVCFGEETWVKINTPNDQDYEVIWNDQILNDATVTGQPGFYTIQVNELFSGCSEEYTIELEGAAPLKANFSVNPNQPCIDIIENQIDIIDLGVGYSDGWMDYGDGTGTTSLFSGDLSHEYNEIGDFKITQYVVNDLGCTDSLSQWICVANKVQYFIPNVFTPNGDDDNDVFKIFLFGADQLEWSIYDRWGETVFKSNSVDDGWDGTLDGSYLVPGVFVVKINFVDAVTKLPYQIVETLTMIK